jgi:hypothetical protein
MELVSLVSVLFALFQLPISFNFCHQRNYAMSAILVGLENRLIICKKPDLQRRSWDFSI